MYNVPKSTLHDRISGRVGFGCRSGPQSYLSDTEEDELVRFIEGCNTIGYSRTKRQIMELVQLVMSDKGRNVKVTEGWWSSFRRRHPQLVLRTAEPVSRIRHVGTTPEILNNYFDLLEETFTEYDLHTQPASIFNMDETGMPLNPVCPKVVSHGYSYWRQVTNHCCVML
jgi:hypothetical protein